MARATAKYRITADDQSRRGIGAARRQLRRLKMAASAVSSTIGNVTANALRSLAGAVGRTADRIDDLSRAGARLGTDIQEAGLLEYLATLNNISLDQIVDSVKTLDERIGELARDPKNLTLRRLFFQLGIGAEQLAKLDPAEKILAMAKALKQVPTDERRADLINQLMGAGARPLFARGPERLLRDIGRFGELGGGAGLTGAAATAQRRREAEAALLARGGGLSTLVASVVNSFRTVVAEMQTRFLDRMTPGANAPLIRETEKTNKILVEIERKMGGARFQ